MKVLPLHSSREATLGGGRVETLTQRAALTSRQARRNCGDIGQLAQRIDKVSAERFVSSVIDLPVLRV